jgi:hypothetical protein
LLRLLLQIRSQMAQTISADRVELLQQVLSTLNGLLISSTQHAAQWATTNVRLTNMEAMLMQQQQSIKCLETAVQPPNTSLHVAEQVHEAQVTNSSPSYAKSRLFRCPFAGCNWYYKLCSAASGIRYVVSLL